MNSKPPISQLPLDFAVEPSVYREDIVQSPANALAIAMIDSWPQWPGHSVTLVGPEGSGKSHIANAWLSNAGAVIVEASALNGQVHGLQEKLLGGSNIIVEDMGRSKIDETELFHLLNTVRQQGLYCLLTARTRPAKWGITLPDLASRLFATQVVELDEPDEMLLAQVMVKLFSDRQLVVDQRIIDYCVLRMERSLGSATRLVAVIDEIALSNKGPVTRILAAEALTRLGMN